MKTEATSALWKRKLRQVDNALYNAITTMFPYYGLLMRADPILGAMIESLILEWEEHRRQVKFIYETAWQATHKQFTTIGNAADLIAKERAYGRTGTQLCRDYSPHWDRLVHASSKLLEARARALHKRLDWPPDKQET